jgi:chemotaxis protein methyltransferase CheR
VLTRDKEYLLESRLLPVARKHQKDSLEALSQALGRRDGEIEKDVVEALTTNESFFFRDDTVFKHFQELVVPALRATRAGARKLRIWSAACSSGQEPYSIAMLLKEQSALPPDWQLELIGSDLSTRMVERARAGFYNHFEVQRGLPIKLLTRYFRKEGEGWAIAPELRNQVSFRTNNLLHDFAALGTFDVIFCRNVLIYFDAATKSDILARMSRQLAPDGFLFLGGAETVVGITDRFVPQPGRTSVDVHAARAATPARAVAAR